MTEDGVDIIGIGTSPSKGLRKGVVVNIESDGRRRSSRRVERGRDDGRLRDQHGLRRHRRRPRPGLNSHGIVAVKDREVREDDIARVIDAAKAIAIPMDREVLHVLPQEYIVDDQDGISEPLGMSGVRLEAKVHIVTAAVASAQNIIKCANRCGLEVADIVLEPLASRRGRARARTRRSSASR